METSKMEIIELKMEMKMYENHKFRQDKVKSKEIIKERNYF